MNIMKNEGYKLTYLKITNNYYLILFEALERLCMKRYNFIKHNYEESSMMFLTLYDYGTVSFIDVHNSKFPYSLQNQNNNCAYDIDKSNVI